MDRPFTIIILFVLLFTGCSKSENFELERHSEEVAYDSYAQTKMDIYYQNKQKQPVLIFIHGGGWCGGDKSEWTNTQTSAFLENNFVCVSLNYRLSSVAPATNNNIAHPAHIKDIAKAVAWVQNNISVYGGNPHRIVLVGHSAGAHLAALLVTNQKYLLAEGGDIRNIKKVVLLDAGTYLSSSDHLPAYLQPYFDKATGDGSIPKSDFIPADYLSEYANYPDFLLIHSSDPYRIDANKSYAAALKSNSIRVTRLQVNINDHYTMLTSFPFYESVNSIDYININSY